MASSTPRHDHKNSDEKRTCATQFKRPIETSKLKLSQRSNQRHWPLPAPLGYMCRLAPSKESGTGIGSSSTMAACFQASNCSLSSCGISRLHGLCCPSRKYTLRTRVSTPRPTISGEVFVSIGILAFSPSSSRGACYLLRAQTVRPHRRGPCPTVRPNRPTGTRHPSSPHESPRQGQSCAKRGSRAGKHRREIGRHQPPHLPYFSLRLLMP